MQEMTLRLYSIGNISLAAAVCDNARITDLSAAFGIERSSVEENNNIIAFNSGIYFLTVSVNCEDFGIFRSPSVQFSSVAQSCLTLCDSMDCSTPGFPVHQQLPELTHES